MPVQGDRWVIRRIDNGQKYYFKGVSLDQVKHQVFSWTTDERKAMVFSSMEAAESMKKLARGYGKIVRKGGKEHAAVHKADHKV